MALTIDTVLVKQYGSTLDTLLQLRGGKFVGKSLEDSITGEERYYDQLDAVFAAERTAIFGDSPEADVTLGRRKVVATPYEIGLGLDDIEKVQTLVSLEGDYVNQMVTALNRKRDIEFMTGALGTAATGKAGAGSATLGASQTVDVATGSTASTGFNLSKLAAAREQMQTANVDLDDPMNKAYIAITPQMLHELLEDDKVTSTDYATVKALVNGSLNSFYGFEFVVSNMLPYMNDAGTAANLDWNASDVAQDDTGANDIRAAFAWVKSGIRTVTNPETKTQVAERADKSFNWYAYACLRTGSVRMEEDKVQLVPCDQSPA